MIYKSTGLRSEDKKWVVGQRQKRMVEGKKKNKDFENNGSGSGGGGEGDGGRWENNAKLNKSWIHTGLKLEFI